MTSLRTHPSTSALAALARAAQAADDIDHGVEPSTAASENVIMHTFYDLATPSTVLSLIARISELESSLCHICHRHRDSPGALLCSAAHTVDRQAARITSLSSALREACDLAVSMAADSWRDDPEFVRLAALKGLANPDKEAP